MDVGAFSLLLGVAGGAPACALTGAFAEVSASPSSGPASIVVSSRFDDSKARGGGLVPPSNS